MSSSSASMMFSTNCVCAAPTSPTAVSPESLLKQSITDLFELSGRFIGLHATPKDSVMSLSSRSMSAFSPSILLITIATGMEICWAALSNLRVLTSIPAVALMTTTPLSAPSMVPMAPPMKSG